MDLSILRAATAEPDREALIVGDDVYTYARLADHVRGASTWLRQQGVDGSTSRVAMVGEAAVENIVLVLALVELGVPVVLIHPRESPEERRSHAAEAEAEIFLEPPPNASWSAFADGEPPGRGGEVDERHALAIVRTSGTSGRPKWVVLSRRAFVASAAASAANLGWQDDDRWLLSLPIAHVGGLSILTRCLLARRAVVLEPAERFDAADFVATVDRHRVTLVSLVPTMLGRVLDLDDGSPSVLRAILVGGAAASPDLLARSVDRGWPVLATYGLTEACSQVATQAYGGDPRGELGCGRPLAGVEIRTRDGVIEVRGDVLMDGYLGSSPGTDFTPDGWFRTGDMGHLDAEGRLHVHGRRDGVIVSGGENVHPSEVEQALEAHPAIRAACVFGVADERWGHVVAAAVTSDEATADDELIAFLDTRLAAFKRPRRIIFLENLPRSATGKLDRAQIRSLSLPLLRPLKR